MTKTRKIPMRKRAKPKQRSTTFTKRRFGLFSKAAELCVLFEAQVAILVKSINQKHGDVYSFGHPSVDEVLEAFVSNGIPKPVDNRTQQYAVALHDQCRAHKKAESEEEEEEEDSNKFWLELENLDLDSVQSLEVLSVVAEKIKALRENVKNRLKSLSSVENPASGSGSTSSSIDTLAAPDSNDDEKGFCLLEDGNKFMVINDDHQMQFGKNLDDFLMMEPPHEYYPGLSSIWVSNFDNNVGHNRTASVSIAASYGSNNVAQIGGEVIKQSYTGGGECSNKKADVECMELEVIGKEEDDFWINFVDEI